MEFWSVVWFGIALIAGGMYLRLRRGHQTLAEKMQTLSTELGQVDAKYTLDRAQMDFLCDFAQNFDGEISSTESKIGRAHV